MKDTAAGLIEENQTVGQRRILNFKRGSIFLYIYFWQSLYYIFVGFRLSLRLYVERSRNRTEMNKSTRIASATKGTFETFRSTVHFVRGARSGEWDRSQMQSAIGRCVSQPPIWEPLEDVFVLTGVGNGGARP